MDVDDDIVYFNGDGGNTYIDPFSETVGSYSYSGIQIVAGNSKMKIATYSSYTYISLESDEGYLKFNDFLGTVVLHGADEVFIDADVDVLINAGDNIELDAANDIIIDCGSGYSVDFKVAGVAKMVLDASALYPYSDSAVDLGKTDKYFKCGYIDDVYTGRVFLGGTGPANILDDYEEGYYTPLFKYGASSFSLNSSYNSLAYTKIGRQVTVTGEIKVGTTSARTGTLSLSLPFAIGSLTDAQEAISGQVLYGGINALDEAGTMMLYGASGSTVYLVEQTLTGSNGNCADHVLTNSIFYFSFTYFVAT